MLLSSPPRGGAAAILVIGLRSLALAVTILTGLVSAALLGATGRGVLAALLTGPAFLSGVCSMGLHAAVIYRMKEKPKDAKRYFGTALILALAFGAAAIAIGWVITPLWLHKYDANTIWYGRLLLLALPLTMATWTMTGAAESQGWFAFANGTLYLQNCAVLALLGLLAWTKTHYTGQCRLRLHGADGAGIPVFPGPHAAPRETRFSAQHLAYPQIAVLRHPPLRRGSAQYLPAILGSAHRGGHPCPHIWSAPIR